jgi:hypothetical protein
MHHLVPLPVPEGTVSVRVQWHVGGEKFDEFCAHYGVPATEVQHFDTFRTAQVKADGATVRIFGGTGRPAHVEVVVTP